MKFNKFIQHIYVHMYFFSKNGRGVNFFLNKETNIQQKYNPKCISAWTALFFLADRVMTIMHDHN